MSSTINATTVGVGGVVTTADNSGILVLQTASTDAVTISAAQGVTLAGTLGVTGATTLSSTLAVTGITTVAAGSAAAPSIVSTTGTSDTGEFFPAADTIAYSTAGTERIRITSGGLFGIGCTPARQLSVQYPFAKTDTTSRAVAVFKSNDASNANEMLISSVGAASQASRVWKIQTGEDGVSNAGSISLQPDGGNVGIGTTSVSYKLHVRTSAVTGLAGFTYTPQIVTESNATGGFGMHTPTANQGVIAHSTPLDQTSAAIHFDGASRYMSFATVNDTERMRIDSSGNVLIGTTSSGGVGFTVATDASGRILTSNVSVVPFDVYLFKNNSTTVGKITINTSSTAYTTTSDYRLKENVTPLTGALSVVNQLNPVNFTWKLSGESTQGFIAHELQEVVPDCVTGKKDDTHIEEYEISPAVEATFDEQGNELTAAVDAVMGERESPKYQGVDTSFLVATLTAAIQELKAIIDTQAARITALETL